LGFNIGNVCFFDWKLLSRITRLGMVHCRLFAVPDIIGDSRVCWCHFREACTRAAEWVRCSTWRPVLQGPGRELEAGVCVMQVC